MPAAGDTLPTGQSPETSAVNFAWIPARASLKAASAATELNAWRQVQIRTGKRAVADRLVDRFADP